MSVGVVSSLMAPPPAGTPYHGLAVRTLERGDRLACAGRRLIVAAMKRASWWPLVGFAGAVAASALVGGVTQKRSRAWYRALRKPAFTPPDWIFGPVWTGLYALMAGSVSRAWRQPPSPTRSRALALWGAQLAANAAWTPLFFGARRPGWALADLALLIAGIGAYVNEVRKVDRAAAWMMAPYGAWSAFAAALNEEIVRLN